MPGRPLWVRGRASLNIEVSREQILSAGSKTDEWLTYSGSLDGHRYTPLNQITPANVSQLRIRWVRQFDTTCPHIEATPLVVDGVIFTTEPPSDTFAVDALDAKSGRTDLEIFPKRSLRCARLLRSSEQRSRILDNHLYLTSLDGYLVCTRCGYRGDGLGDPGSRRFSRLFDDCGATNCKSLGCGRDCRRRIWNSRFPSCLRRATGKKQWQFDTIPGPGEPGHETWPGDSWRTGGGSTWVTGSYDPSLDLLYWGVGNPAPAFSEMFVVATTCTPIV